MITNDDLLLSKMSYTDKDFASIYPDLLDLAKNLTDKWDPSLSNESDPGVVLLKEGAFMVDHLNYNVDKNILENFLPSATQESSVRNILDMNGYNPRYYVSALGSISFTYKTPDGGATFPSSGVKIPAFTLCISNEDENVFYTQVKDLNITAEGVISSCKFIEGQLSKLSVNSKEVITLENLDDNNRVYLPHKNVAQNGIFIVNSDDTEFWTKTNYLLTEPLKSKVYKVGYDSSKKLPYVEFPSDIRDIIGNGVYIWYITSSGLSGNVKASTLTKITSDTTYKVSDDYSLDLSGFTLTNSGSITNGKDPETIDEMYSSFKKIVGTFDTLVTRKDYENYINTMVDDYDNKIVSNCVVTDRTTDYNNAIDIATYDEYGEYFENAGLNAGVVKYELTTTQPTSGSEAGKIWFDTGTSKFKIYNGTSWVETTELSYEDFVTATAAMSPYDLCIYALKAFSMSDYTQSSPSTALDNSFTPVSNDTLGEIKIDLAEQSKCINHTFKDINNGKVFCFKNYTPLNIVITPYDKVTKSVRADIVNNICKALTENFNSSQIEFGEELNYDEIVDIIIKSDDRIRSIRLSDFDYNTVALVKDSTEQSGYKNVDLFKDSTLLLDLVAKNVLAGRICLFDFDEDFDYKYGQKDTALHKGVTSIQSEVEINTTENTEAGSITNYSYTLQDNENILIAYPSYSSDLIYPANVWYSFKSDNTSAKILADTDYELGATEHLYIQYTQSGVTKNIDYGQNEVVRANFDIPVTTNGTNKIWTNNGTEVNTNYVVLASDEQIEHRVINKSTLSGNSVPCYWIMSNEENRLFGASDLEVILGSGEYFIYSNSSLDLLTVCGAGTKLVRKTISDGKDWTIKKTTIESVDTGGTTTSGLWRYFNFSGTDQSVDIQVLNLVTLNKDASIVIDATKPTGATTLVLDNTWRLLEKSTKKEDVVITYTADETTTTLNKLFTGYQIRSKLEINTNSSDPQALYTNQKVTLYKGSSDTTGTTITGDSTHPVYLQSSYEIDVAGDTKTQLINSDGEAEAANFMQYTLDKLEDSTGSKIKQLNSGLYTITLSNIDTTLENGWYMPFSYTMETGTSRNYILPIYANMGTGDSLKFKVQYNTNNTDYNFDVDDFNESTSDSSGIVTITKTGLYLFRLSQGTSGIITSGNANSKLIITEKTIAAGNNPYITIFDPKVFFGVNPMINLSVDVEESGQTVTKTFDLYADSTHISIPAAMKALVDGSNKPTTKINYAYIPDNSIAIQDDTFDELTMWDKNNIVNIITIPQIDINNSTVDIAKSMRAY